MSEGTRVVAVVGGASGIGAAAAARFAAAGDRVVVLDRNAPAGGVASAAVEARRLDVTDSAACDAAIAAILADHGRLDVLVNTAGVIGRTGILETSDEDWRRQFAVNADGTFFTCRAAARVMAAAGSGAIVNVASMWGTIAGPGHLAYCASKGAVVQLTRAMALDLAKTGVRVNAVCPGEVDTPMLRAGGREQALDDAAIGALGAKAVPIGRVAQPDEIASVIQFLASPEAGYMTGAIVPVDAGCTTG